jgi:iron complex transport system substrate-binding protein
MTSAGAPRATTRPSRSAIRWVAYRQAWLRSCRTATSIRPCSCSSAHTSSTSIWCWRSRNVVGSSSSSSWGSSWQDEILAVGRAVGKPEEARRLRDRAAAQLAAAARAHPEFEGQTAAVATPYQGIYVYGPQDARSGLLVDLGFTFPPVQDIGGKEFGGKLSDEQVDLLDVGTLLWFANPGAADRVRKNPLYRKLDVHAEGRDVFLAEKGALYEATSFISVLSIPLLMDQLVPKLAAAADGDPGT